jgi:3'-5' exoribonuclease
MRRLYLRDCSPGDVVEDVFVVTNKQLAATSNGKPYIKAFCSDRTSQVTVRIWNATREMFNAIPDGGFLRIRGHVENYQNNLQLIIEQIWAAKEGTFDIADLMPHTDKDVDQMCQRLFEICQSVQNRYLSALVQAYLDDEELMNNFCRAPAAMTFHHAFVGGLLEHTLNAMEVADAVCRFYPKLNRDLVISGVFLHDLAKTWELSYENAYGYTDGGQLVGHIVKGAIWVEKKAKEAEASLGEPIPQKLIDVVQHIILSHHGEPEFGAARLPSTPEAIAVHVIENLDAKLMMALQLTRGDSTESNWTEYLKQFGGRLYRPDVAPSDVDGEGAEAAGARGAGNPALANSGAGNQNGGAHPHRASPPATGAGPGASAGKAASEMQPPGEKLGGQNPSGQNSGAQQSPGQNLLGQNSGGRNLAGQGSPNQRSGGQNMGGNSSAGSPPGQQPARQNQGMPSPGGREAAQQGRRGPTPAGPNRGEGQKDGEMGEATKLPPEAAKAAITNPLFERVPNRKA